jgi:hypothetical protein
MGLEKRNGQEWNVLKLANSASRYVQCMAIRLVHAVGVILQPEHLQRYLLKPCMLYRKHPLRQVGSFRYFGVHAVNLKPTLIMKPFFSILVMLLLLMACGKDTPETRPSIKFKSANTTDVALNQNLFVTLEFADKEGDISDTLFIVRQRLNANGPLVKDPLPYVVPQFPKAQQGDLELNLEYFTDLTLQLDPIRIPGSNPPQNEVDTLTLKFVLKDKAGNISDTALLENLRVQR